MTTKAPRIQVNHDGEARCNHRDCYGNVCTTCFNATPFLQTSYGMTYMMTGAEYIDGDVENVSPATPKVDVINADDLKVGDTILGYSKTPKTAQVVKDVVNLPQGKGVTTTKDARLLIVDSRIVVIHSN